MDKLPEHLLDEIRKGNCVAFVGAGFGIPAGLPRWGDLLRGVITSATRAGYMHGVENLELIHHLQQLVDAGTADSFDRAAQTMSDFLSSAVFEKFVAEQIDLTVHDGLLPQQMRRRLELLQQIPFRAILTTNYDLLLQGPTPFNHDRPFREVLRPSSDDEHIGLDRFREEVYDIMELAMLPAEEKARRKAMQTMQSTGLAWASTMSAVRKKLGIPEFRVPILQVHGSVMESNTIVCTRSAYRRLLYNAPGYQTFIQSLMATCTMFYMGFSFTDSYLNESRSAVLSMLDWTGPIATTPVHHEDATPHSVGQARPALPSPMPGGVRRNVSAISGKTGSRPPIAYAIINDQTDTDRVFLRRHEGVHVLTWSTYRGTDREDWKGFDRYLEGVYEATNAHHHIGKALFNTRILSIDPGEMFPFLSEYCREAVSRYQLSDARRVAADTFHAASLASSTGAGAGASHTAPGGSSGGARPVSVSSSAASMPGAAPGADRCGAPFSGGFVMESDHPAPALPSVTTSDDPTDCHTHPTPPQPPASSGVASMLSPAAVCAPAEVKFEMVGVTTAERGMQILRTDPKPFDIIVCNYGYRGPTREPVIVEFMRNLHTNIPLSHRAPVVVFSTGAFATDNRRVAMRAGAYDYCCSALGLLQRFEQVLTYDDR